MVKLGQQKRSNFSISLLQIFPFRCMKWTCAFVNGVGGHFFIVIFTWLQLYSDIQDETAVPYAVSRRFSDVWWNALYGKYRELIHWRGNTRKTVMKSKNLIIFSQCSILAKKHTKKTYKHQHSAYACPRYSRGYLPGVSSRKKTLSS